MTSRYDELSPRARWFLQNFDEIDIADICANNEAAAAKAQAAIERLRAAVHVADDQDVTDWQRGYRACSERALAALDQPAETGEQP